MMSHTGNPGRPGTAAGPPWRQPQVVRTSELRGCEDLVGSGVQTVGGTLTWDTSLPKRSLYYSETKLGQLVHRQVNTTNRELKVS